MIGAFIKKWLPSIIATLTGLVVLVGYLMPAWTGLRNRLVEWAVVVAAFAFVLGAVNVLIVHGKRVFVRQQGRLCSLVLLLAGLVTLAITIWNGPSGGWTQKMFDYVIGPLGASLAALVAFTLALAAFRLLRARRNTGAVVFMLVVVVALATSAMFAGLEAWIPSSTIPTIRDWLVNVVGMAGMRGLLLGVALGTVITALRVLATIDRPHSES